MAHIRNKDMRHHRNKIQINFDWNLIGIKDLITY